MEHPPNSPTDGGSTQDDDPRPGPNATWPLQTSPIHSDLTSAVDVTDTSSDDPVSDKGMSVGAVDQTISDGTVGEGVHATGVMESADLLSTPEQPVPTGRHRRRMHLIPAAVFVVIVMIAGVVLSTVSTPLGPGGVLSAAASNALDAKTAQLSLGGTLTITLKGTRHKLNLMGTGQADFSHNLEALTVSFGISGITVKIGEVQDGQSLYVKVPGETLIAPGKSWVTEKVPSSVGSTTTPTKEVGALGNPSALLQILAHKGATVTPIGSSTIGGTKVQGYSATFTKAQIAQRLASENITSSVRSAAAGFASDGIATKLYVNGSNQLVRMFLHLGGALSHVDFTMTMTLDFAHYGTPVEIAIPAASTVTTSQQLKVAAAAKGAIGR